MATHDRDVEASVLSLLQRLNGLEPLKELFWAQLGYNRANTPLARRGWPAGEAGLLADDPVLFATAGADAAFHVLFCRLAGPTASTGAERVLMKRLLRDHPYALFVFCDAGAMRWHFVNAKVDAADAGRTVLRRIAAGVGEPMRTAAERLALLDVTETPEAPVLALQAKCDEAFDVEAVTKRFFAEYHVTFTTVKTRIAAVSPGISDSDAHTFTLTLMNRMMFCWFIQQKEWLNGERDYLTSAWEQCHITDRDRAGDCDQRGEAFYRDWLRPLYLGMFNTPVAGRDPEVARRLGRIPYLNGGLFEENALDTRAVPGAAGSDIHVPNGALDLLLSDRPDEQGRIRGLFRRWNFTVQESTPLDIEVAVDPEMLGKVFEELMNELTSGGDTQRHATGAYYTPRAIVSFMCQEALIGHLESDPLVSKHNTRAHIRRLVYAYDAEGLPDKDAVRRALEALRICDPACGSGAYVLGMLQELMTLRRTLYGEKALDWNVAYDWKRDIIKRNLYGVDIEPSAVEIARLRLWLSLAVDLQETDPLQVPPLPNLDFLVEVGDSVKTPAPNTGQLVTCQPRIAHLAALKRREIDETEQELKKGLRTQIAEEKSALRRDLAIADDLPFDWRVDFAEVVTASEERPGGFDIILANPPYVRQELIKEQKPTLQRVFADLYCGTADLYVYFYYRALQLLRPGGMLVFISSNKWLKAGYGAKLRGYLAKTTQVRSITDFGDLPVFQTAIAYPMIIVARKGRSAGAPGAQASRLLMNEKNDEAGETPALPAALPATIFTQVKSMKAPYPHVKALMETRGTALPVEALAGETWRLGDADTLQIIRRMETGTVPLGEYVGGRIYYGIKTGLNAAFFIDGATRAALLAADARSEEIIKPLLLGKDIGRWNAQMRDRWLILTKIGVPIAQYPAVFTHLKQWQPELEKRWDKGEHWWELRSCDYYNAFDEPKILYQEIATYQAFAYDTTGALTNNKVFLIPGADLYLLAILNSQHVFDFLVHTCAKLQGGAFAMQYPFVSRIPIPDASPADRAALAALAEACLAKRGAGCAAEEAEINARVAGLYGV